MINIQYPIFPNRCFGWWQNIADISNPWQANICQFVGHYSLVPNERLGSDNPQVRGKLKCSIRYTQHVRYRELGRSSVDRHVILMYGPSKINAKGHFSVPRYFCFQMWLDSVQYLNPSWNNIILYFSTVMSHILRYADWSNVFIIHVE